jgi:Gylcosyl hydrolase family 115 C-terminal domain
LDGHSGFREDPVWYCFNALHQSTCDALVEYKMKMSNDRDSVTVRLVFGVVLPLNKKEHSIEIGFKSAASKKLTINENLTWEKNYSHLYPTAASRVIEKQIVLPKPRSSDGFYKLEIKAVDPGIVLHKVIVDNGGFEETRLYMPETPYIKEQIRNE